MPFPYSPIPGRRFTGRAAVTPPRQWIPAPDDLPPPDATPPVPDVCLLCPAAARLVLRGVTVSVPDGWTQVQATGVTEMHLCGHHGDRHEAALIETGWITVLDIRSRIEA